VICCASAARGVDYLNEQIKKLRETSEGIVEKGKELVGHRYCSVNATTEAENQHQEERREHRGG
jgi:hypothetical protein